MDRFLPVADIFRIFTLNDIRSSLATAFHTLAIGYYSVQILPYKLDHARDKRRIGLVFDHNLALLPHSVGKGRAHRSRINKDDLDVVVSY
jgi:hypothetical protein